MITHHSIWRRSDVLRKFSTQSEPFFKIMLDIAKTDMSLVGVDIGSSGIRAVAFAVMEFRCTGVNVLSIEPLFRFVEVEPDEIWHAFVQVSDLFRPNKEKCH